MQITNSSTICLTNSESWNDPFYQPLHSAFLGKMNSNIQYYFFQIYIYSLADLQNRLKTAKL